MSASFIRRALPDDVEELLRLEHLCFHTDRISRRSFRRWLRHDHCIFLVSASDSGLSGYILVIRRRGTRLARLYSLAVDPASSGRGVASRLISEAEAQARSDGAIYMRLEVAEGNAAAIGLYARAGYRPFGLYRDYYDDHSDAVRMEKCIHPYEPASTGRVIPWIPQSTEFTCGPASLMMAMSAIDPEYTPGIAEEIQIWREATTIFMTSGHGGCHPVGLALSAARRGFRAQVWINQTEPLFLEGVRSVKKKQVMKLAHDGFIEEAAHRGIPIHYTEVEQQLLVDRFDAGDNILILISTYRMDRKKAPHWVVLSGYDDSCLFVHDPDAESVESDHLPGEAAGALDCQHLPIARDDFAAMSRFGGSRLRTAVLLGGPGGAGRDHVMSANYGRE